MRPRALHNLKTIGVSLALLTSCTAWVQVCSAPGKDGPAAISGVVNTYYEPSPNGTYGPATTNLALVNPRGATGTLISPGDLVMVIQMQCETVSTANSVDYGGNNSTSRGYTDPATGCRAGQYELRFIPQPLGQHLYV